MPKSPDKPLINMVMDHDEVDVLEEFQHENRFPSRAAAMRYLMASRLAQKPRPTREERAQFNRIAS